MTFFKFLINWGYPNVESGSELQINSGLEAANEPERK